MRKHLFVAAACLLFQAARAGTVYKCVEDGKASYSDRPCGKTAVVLATPEAPADTAQAAQRLAHERALLRGIEEERAAREQQEAREQQRARQAALVQRKRCDKLRLQRKWAIEDIARAGREGAQQARIKAQRQAEALALECPA